MTPKPHVLLIEDNSDLAELYATMLHSANFMVSLAADGDSALKILQNRQFDLIFLDLLLPDMDGLSLLKQLPQLRLADRQGPVLVLTNLVDPQLMVELKAHGAQDCFVKTELTPDDFIQVAQAACACSQDKT